MPLQVYIALFGWLGATFALFRCLGPVRGLAASVVGGFLFLTPVAIQLAPGVPLWTRASAISTGALFAVFALYPQSIRSYRFHWLDLTMIVALVAWGAANFAAQGGLAQAVIDWWWFAMHCGIPYFLGRVVCSSPAALPALSRCIAAGVLLMLPVVLYELRFSPMLHSQLYGVQVGNVHGRFRLGGWRAQGLQPDTLGMAVWLAAAAVVPLAFYWSSLSRKLWHLPTGVVAIAALTAGALSRGAGAISLLVVGVGLLAAVKFTGRARIAHLLPAAIALYLVTALLDSQIPIREQMISVATSVFGTERGRSLDTRLRNETFFVQSALRRPLLGWGGWGDFMDQALAKEVGHRKIIPDAWWTIVLGQRGLVGLISLYAAMVLPGVLAIERVVRIQVHASLQLLVVGLAMFCWIYAADLLFNAFPSPVLFLTSASLVSVLVAARRPAGSALQVRVAESVRSPVHRVRPDTAPVGVAVQ